MNVKEGEGKILYNSHDMDTEDFRETWTTAHRGAAENDSNYGFSHFFSLHLRHYSSFSVSKPQPFHHYDYYSSEKTLQLLNCTTEQTMQRREEIKSNVRPATSTNALGHTI